MDYGYTFYVSNNECSKRRMNRIERIKSILQKLAPDYLEVRDETYLHKGHREASDAEHTHLKIIISDVFGDIKILEKHRKIKDLISREFNQGLHAVSISFKNP